MRTTKNLSLALGSVVIAACLAACGGGGGGGGNQAPVAAELKNMVVLAGAEFNLTLPAYTDANNDALTYSVTQANGSPLPAGLTFTPATRTLAGTAQLDVKTPLEVKVTASDPSGAAVSATFTLSSVDQGVYKYANQADRSLFYGVVFPASTGKAEVWTWEFSETADYTKLYKSDLSVPVTSSFVTTAANRRTASSVGAYAFDASVVTTVSRGAAGVQNFNVGGSARSGTFDSDAWSANATYSSNDWQGTWVVEEMDTTIKHVWTVAADGTVSGNRKNGNQVLCTVENASAVSLLSSPVSRIKVTENCGTVQSPDLQVLEGISFVDSKSGAQITNRVVLLNGSGGTTTSNKFLTKIACRNGTASCTAP